MFAHQTNPSPEPLMAGRAPVSLEHPITRYALRLRGIRVHGHVGVSQAEREKRQELVVAVDLELDGRRYPSSDELERAADYAEIVRAADESARDHAFSLLETYALRLARRLGERWPGAERVCVSVTKASVPVLPATEAASVEVTLGKAVA